MQTFWRSQFDKILMAGLFLTCMGVGVLVKTNDRLTVAAEHSADAILGSLLTLVTVRKLAVADNLADPTSGTTRSSTTIETEVKV